MKHTELWLLSGMVLILSLVMGSFSNSVAETIPTKPRYLNDSSRKATLISDNFYTTAGLQQKGLDSNIYLKAKQGFDKLNSSGCLKKQLLAIVDMSQPSCQKRLYILDMENKQLLVHTLAAHGRNSGEYSATRFSNTPESLQSSLGFYITGNTYQGGNGYSMKLKGLEKGFNDKAESRAIVMHGAAYVSESMARQTGRIGRSWGCPAVSVAEHKQIIDLLKNGSCLFIYAPEKNYLAQSAFIKG